MIYLIDREHPLALYVFTKDKKVKETCISFLVIISRSVVADLPSVFARTQSGGAVANDVVIYPGGKLISLSEHLACI